MTWQCMFAFSQCVNYILHGKGSHAKSSNQSLTHLNSLNSFQNVQFFNDLILKSFWLLGMLGLQIGQELRLGLTCRDSLKQFLKLGINVQKSLGLVLDQRLLCLICLTLGILGIHIGQEQRSQDLGFICRDCLKQFSKLGLNVKSLELVLGQNYFGQFRIAHAYFCCFFS